MRELDITQETILVLVHVYPHVLCTTQEQVIMPETLRATTQEQVIMPETLREIIHEQVIMPETL